MGLLIKGNWTNAWFDTQSTGGKFVRQDAAFRDWIGAATPGSLAQQQYFPAERGRYHLYVSLACPWAHRTLIMRSLKRLEDLVSVSITHWRMAERGWSFDAGPGVVRDDVNCASAVHELYVKARPDFTGRATVPILWDKVSGQIVNNESSEIIRIFNSSFDHLGAGPGDYWPAAFRTEIDAVNSRVYAGLNNGVYRAGFATSQAAYEEAVTEVFATLDWLEERLEDRQFLIGSQLTEADIRLFTTLARFDVVYVGLFKCNVRRILDYPNLSAYLSRLLRLRAFSSTTDWFHIKNHYYALEKINPSGIVPVGPSATHGATLAT